MHTIIIIGNIGLAYEEDASLLRSSDVDSNYIMTVNGGITFSKANAHFSNDQKFLRLYSKLWRKYDGLKICSTRNANSRITTEQFRGVMVFERGRKGMFDVRPGKVCKNVCSGLTAINVAYHLGFKKVVLVGFKGGPQPTYSRHSDEIISGAKRWGMKIVSVECSENHLPVKVVPTLKRAICLS